MAATSDHSSRAPISTTNTTTTTSGETEDLLHPDQFGPLKVPKALSPSAVMEFKNCPQSFLLQYIYKLRQPNSLATAKGSMCHEALEKVFDLDPQERSLENLQNLLRVSWGKNRLSEKYSFLFENEEGEWDLQAEKEWGQSALQLLENYYQLEDPKEIVRPNPLRREVWLHSHLAVDPSQGVTAANHRSDPDDGLSSEGTFYMRGIVDRLDMVRQPSGNEQSGKRSGVALKIVDYKTGKAPALKYSKPVNDRILEESFYQLKIYALLLKEKGASDNDSSGSSAPSMNTMDLRYLELMYLNSELGRAKSLFYDLGETPEERNRVLQDIHRDLSQVWKDISDLVALNDPKAFIGCDRSFCHCHKCREQFVPGTLWEP